MLSLAAMFVERGFLNPSVAFWGGSWRLQPNECSLHLLQLNARAQDWHRPNQQGKFIRPAPRLRRSEDVRDGKKMARGHGHREYGGKKRRGNEGDIVSGSVSIWQTRGSGWWSLCWWGSHDRQEAPSLWPQLPEVLLSTEICFPSLLFTLQSCMDDGTVLPECVWAVMKLLGISLYLNTCSVWVSIAGPILLMIRSNFSQ